MLSRKTSARYDFSTNAKAKAPGKMVNDKTISGVSCDTLHNCFAKSVNQPVTFIREMNNI
jgi:hypothetical protein